MFTLIVVFLLLTGIGFYIGNYLGEPNAAIGRSPNGYGCIMFFIGLLGLFGVVCAYLGRWLL